MAINTAETQITDRRRQVGHIKLPDLTPDLQFEYQVRAEKGSFGDFPTRYREKPHSSEVLDERFRFALNGSWLIRATIFEATKDGPKASFDVLQDDDVLMNVVGIIIPRPINPNSELRPRGIVVSPILEGYSTIIEPISVDGNEPNGHNGQIIPARNIHEGTLYKLGRMAYNL